MLKIRKYYKMWYIINNIKLQVFLISLASFSNMVLASHIAEDHGGSSYEEKTKTVEIPIIKKYGKLIFF